MLNLFQHLLESDTKLGGNKSQPHKDLYDGNKQQGKISETKPKLGVFDYENYWKSVKVGDKIDHTKVIYKFSDKHHPNAPEYISKPPTDPEGALRKAYKFNDNGKGLIAVDVKNNEIIMFRITHGNEYHGYVFEPKKGKTEYNFLTKLKLIKTNGKIIK